MEAASQPMQRFLASCRQPFPWDYLTFARHPDEDQIPLLAVDVQRKKKAC
jgi:hypothetical protein